MSCGAETEANTLLAALTAGLGFTIPAVNLDDVLFKIPAGTTDAMYRKLVLPTNVDLTTRTVGGSGTFDALMETVSAHLKTEYDKGRITGAEYTRAYIELTQAAMSGAVQFVLGREQAFWQAQQAQVAAITGRVQLETAKVQLAESQIEAQVQKSNYALSKLKLSTESIAYCTAKFNLDNLLPMQLETAQFHLTELLPAQKLGQDFENETRQFTLENLLPEQLQTAQVQRATAQFTLDSLLPEQLQVSMVQRSTAQYTRDYILPEQLQAALVQRNTAQFNLDFILPSQYQLAQTQALIADYQYIAMLPAQRTLIEEQVEVQRAQTTDTRLDGTPVTGVAGKQKELYAQQITSYKRDAEIKAAKLFTDAWITQKTMDEGLVPPFVFTNPAFEAVMAKVKFNNGLD